MYKITYVVIAVILAFHASNGQYLRDRIMGRDMNLTWTKPQHYSNNRTLPNPLEMAKEECLGGNCNITAVDEKNDKHVKVLVNRKRVAAQPMPSAGADMPVKRL